MLTVFADKLSLKRLTAFLAVLGAVTILSLALRALHQYYTPTSESLWLSTRNVKTLWNYSAWRFTQLLVSFRARRGTKQNSFLDSNLRMYHAVNLPQE